MQQLMMNFAGSEWQELKRWLERQKENKVQRILQPATDQREVENIRGSLQFIDAILNQEKVAANTIRE